MTNTLIAVYINLRETASYNNYGYRSRAEQNLWNAIGVLMLWASLWRTQWSAPLYNNQ